MLIYKHTNTINGLSYIGLTSRSMEERLQEHVNSSNIPTTNFHKAINEYGIENFTSEILEYCTSINLREREKYWINYYDTFNNGYNMKLGGGKNSLNNTKRKHLKNKTSSSWSDIIHYTGVESFKLKILNQLDSIQTISKMNTQTYNNFIKYIDIRLSANILLYITKRKHIADKIQHIKYIKNLKNISIQKIDYHISSYKNKISHETIGDDIQNTYIELLSSFDYNCSIYYEEHKQQIIKYIRCLFNMMLELVDINKSINNNINEYIKENNITKYNKSKFTKLYNKLKEEYLKELNSQKTDNEEITTYNKSLNNPTGEVAKEYFKLRKINDKRISDLKSVHKDKKLKLIYDIKQLKNVSIQKIDYNITLYKSSVKENNIYDISDKVYLSLINTFEYNISKYYINNKEVIINYIIEVYKMQLQIIILNKELNSIINQFIKDNNISKYRLARLVTTYKTIKNDLQFYKKYCFDIEQFKQLQSKDDEITTFIEEFFLECVHEIESKRTLNEIYKLNEQNKELDYKFRVSKEYTPKIGNNTKEFVTQSILKETDESVSEENVVETIVENILLNNKETTNLVNKLCELPKKDIKQSKTKREKEIARENKKIGLLAFKNMLGVVSD